MDSETAKVLFKEGAVFILQDLPEGSEFGIDYNAWTVGPKFRGVKMIPPGIHFVYYSSSNAIGQTGMRTGFFYNFKQREVVVKKWDIRAEDINQEEITQEEYQRIVSNMQELDQYLGAYPYENYKKWVSQTSHITVPLLSRLKPECGTIYSVAQFESIASNSQSRLLAEQNKTEQMKSEEHSSKKEKDCLPNLKTIQGTEIRFSRIPKRLYPEGSTPQQITKHSMDSSYRLQSVLSECYQGHPTGILGEMQFAFICFLIGHVYDAFDQWKRLVHLLCTCEEELNNKPDLFIDMISVLYFQVHEIPEDFFVDIVSANNFLTTTLQQLFSNTESGNGNSKLQERARKFKEHLTKKFKWDFSLEADEDDDPVIVETV